MSDAVRSLAWTTLIERASDALPRPRGVARYRRRDFLHDNRVAVAASLDVNAAFPGSGLFVDPVTGASLLVTAGVRPQARSGAAADVVVAGAMRTVEQLRFRSFYLADGRSRSLVVHQRSAPAVATPLVAGARLQSTLFDTTPFVVPRVLETGYADRVSADWVVEETLDGAPVAAADAEATVGAMIGLLAQWWESLGTEQAPLGAAQRTRALTAFADLTDDPPDGVWAADLDRELTSRRVRELLTDERPLTIGLSHGDPGIGNVLRLRDGRLALVDWEDAGHRPVAHDVVKALMSAPDPVALAAALEEPALVAGGAMPWRSQVAVALLLFMSGWRNRYFRAVKRKSIVAGTRRLRTQLHVVATLLDP
ncbi:phosphotransferase [Jiangella asiatica]|nr:phosphotransferase [Jiangella asiatica]